MTKEIKKNTVVLYHGDCSDGFGAAWSAWKKMGDEAEYLPIQNGDPVPGGLVGKEIFMLDISFGAEIIKDLVLKNNKVVIIDHHKSREEDIKFATEHVFDNGHSGSVLSWNYFQKGIELPLLLKYIEDIDLWKFQFEETLPITAYIVGVDPNFKVWDNLIGKVENNESRASIINMGQAILGRDEKMAMEIIKTNMADCEFEGVRGKIINANHFITSAINKLILNSVTKFVVYWEKRNDGRIKVSLRSVGDIDVSEIAKKYGGGGHKNAAGCQLGSGSPLPWKIIENNEK